MTPLPRSQAGFTLGEMVIALILVAVLTPTVFAAFNALNAAREQSYRAEIRRDHERIASALLAYAKLETSTGLLPAPYTGGSYHSSVLDPTATALATHLRAAGLNTSTVNNDGTAAANVRVYQRVTGLTDNVPVFLQSGPRATITYQVGVVTQTACPLNDACNTGLPGASTTLTAGNFTSWTETGSDFASVFVSTLPLQKRMLSETMRRIDTLRQALTRFYQAAERAAAASATTNFFPLPTGAGAADLSGANPVTNEGCHNGWYTLSASNVNVLQQVALSKAEFSVTAWGGAIQYCADYDPAATDTSSADQPPHAAALRINPSVSNAWAPFSVSNLIFPL